jgi:hypothetical protein
VITHQNYKAEANHSIKHRIKSGDLQRNQKRVGYQNPWTALVKELISIAANVPTALGGGNHGHAGIIVEPTKYLVMMVGTAFVNPFHTGIYPEGLVAKAAAETHAMAEAVHKE